jgi:DNA primase
VIPDDQVEEVRARADIVDVISQYVDLKKAGKEFKANCPFHEERTPSFYVVPDKGFYKCFGCGVSGDVFKFLQEKVGLDFVEAVKQVASRSGVEIREVKRGHDPEEDPKRPLYELMAFARSWFREQLLGEVGADARAYLEGRGIDAETSERFNLGFAPDDWRALRDAAHGLGMTDEQLLEVGLLTTSEKSTEPYDKFRNRVIFPIEALRGKVLAFGGRLLGEERRGQPKYLNSPETILYHKGRTLYGLDTSRHAIRREEVALVVEGYMDLVSIAAFGFENTVATLGTAMTIEQARLLKRYTSRVLLLFDSDRAGLKASFRAGDLLLSEGLHPSIVTLPDGEDPDTLVQKEGPDALRGYLDDAVDILDRKLQILEERDYFASIDGRRDAVDRLLPTLRATKDQTLRDIYIDQVAARTGVRRETLQQELARHPGSRPQTADRTARRLEPAPARPRSVDRRPQLGPEWSLLRVLARDRDRRHELVEKALMRIGPEDFKDAVDRAIFQSFVDDPDLDRAPEELHAPAVPRLEALLAEPVDEEQLAHGGREFDEALMTLEGMRIARRIDALQGRIEATTDEQEKLELIGEKQALGAELRALGRPGGSYARRYTRGSHHHDAQ